ncbi:MAG: hypothetical protein H6822_20525 [Planctomycetaceae bacterium]|nr:hypothetical protein [Planctomycetales bacterium]MCB9924576.1 hypothetical protein [Planctomycetaceae bacterium]
MTFDLEITEAAHNDIIRNAAWWAEHHSYDQAIRWRDAIYKQLESLWDQCERQGSDVDRTFSLRSQQYVVSK